MQVIKLEKIKKILESVDVLTAIEKAFVDYSQGKVRSAPVSELIFDNPPGDVHIKSGYLIDDDYYVVKIASGFYRNPILNLPSSHGLMLIFSSKTGELFAILLDEGYLTDLRTAAAGAIAAKYLAPTQVNKIGIIGSGIQARFQLSYLRSVIKCREVLVWGRSLPNLNLFQQEMSELGFSVAIAQDITDITKNCQLIVTTTPSTSPLLYSQQILPGTHITAIGADAAHKQELDENILAKADLIAVDSLQQTAERGEVYHALKKNLISQHTLYELGNIISGAAPKRTNNHQITIADLTGLAAQDIAIAKSVYNSSRTLEKDSQK
jgi:ornithine cyclodeaminase/alanine dehydrogenase-like protein (mu-crystallin family)